MRCKKSEGEVEPVECEVAVDEDEVVVNER